MAERVFITGGADSIGLAMAAAFAARGDAVAICNRRPAALKDATWQIDGLVGIEADVGDLAALTAAVEEAAAHIGAISVLVNNVGAPGPHAAIEAIDLAAGEHVLRVNLTAPLRAMQAVIPAMKRAGCGLILNISTASTRTRLPLRTTYIASKFGLEGPTLNAARELGPAGIRVNAILPGLIDSSRMREMIAATARDKARSPEDIRAGYLEYVSLRTAVDPDEIAGVAVFLASLLFYNQLRGGQWRWAWQLRLALRSTHWRIRWSELVGPDTIAARLPPPIYVRGDTADRRGILGSVQPAVRHGRMGSVGVAGAPQHRPAAGADAFSHPPPRLRR